MSAGPRQPAIPFRDYLVIETSDLEAANPDGSITVPAGGEQVLCEYEPTGDDNRALLHTLGAADANDIQYRLKYGTNTSFTTESPVGLITNPYSFTETAGAPLTTTSTFRYVAVSSRDQDIDLAARMHIQTQ